MPIYVGGVGDRTPGKLLFGGDSVLSLCVLGRGSKAPGIWNPLLPSVKHKHRDQIF